MKVKAKVSDVLHLEDRNASTEDSRTILSEKEFKEFPSVEGRRKRSRDSFGKTEANAP